MTHPFTYHQHQLAKWQPSAHLLGRQVWRGLMRHACDSDTEERRGRAPVTAILPAQRFGPEGTGDHSVIRYRPHSNLMRGYA